MTDIDPELVDDRDVSETDDYPEVELPDYDDSQFELPDDYEDGDVECQLCQHN